MIHLKKKKKEGENCGSAYSEWMLTYENFTGLNGTVPCSLYSILYENHMIEDPFYGLNEYKARELCEKGCTFYSSI